VRQPINVTEARAPRKPSRAPSIHILTGVPIAGKRNLESLEHLPTIERMRERAFVDDLEATEDPTRAHGRPLHALRGILDKVEPGWSAQSCAGLRKVLTPEGHYLWLCDLHAKKYLR